MVSWFGFKAQEVKGEQRKQRDPDGKAQQRQLSGCTWATLSTLLTTLYFGPSNLRLAIIEAEISTF